MKRIGYTDCLINKFINFIINLMNLIKKINNKIKLH